jgi:hypothetical protein
MFNATQGAAISDTIEGTVAFGSLELKTVRVHFAPSWFSVREGDIAWHGLCFLELFMASMRSSSVWARHRPELQSAVTLNTLPKVESTFCGWSLPKALWSVLTLDMRNMSSHKELVCARPWFIVL